MSRLRKHLSFANVTAALALFIALGGTAYAVEELGKNSVGSKQLKKDAVTSVKVKDGSLLPQDFKTGALPAGATGPAGPVGPQGPAGSPGTASGGGSTGTAGGDLTGTYPNPTIRGGAITPEKFGTIPAASATNSTAQSTVNNSFSAIGFNSEAFDTANLHPAGAESRKLIAPIAGIYALDATVAYEGKIGGTRRIFFAINENSVNPVGDTSVVASTADIQFLSTSGLASLKAGDYVVLDGFQNSGGALNIFGAGNNSGPYFSMHWVGPPA